MKLKVLEQWLANPVATAESAGALIFQLWYKHLARQLYGQHLQEPLLSRVLKKSYLINHSLDYLLLDAKQHHWWADKRAEIINKALCLSIR